jgi:hypothetical protein
MRTAHLRRLASAPVFSALLLTAGTALAAAPSISVLGFDSDSQVKGGVPEATATAAALTAQVRSIAHSEKGFTYTSTADVNVADAKLDANCFDEGAGCMATIAQGLNAQIIVWGAVLKKNDGSYSVTFNQLDTSQSKPQTQSLKDTLPAAPTANDISGLAAKDFAKLMGVTQTGTLRVVASVAGASISVDGKNVGTANSTSEPFSTDVPLGSHKVTVSMKGYQDYNEKVDVEEAGASVNATLAPVAAPQIVTPPPPGPGPTPPAPSAPVAPGSGWRTTFYIAAPVAVLSIAGATVFGLQVNSAQTDKNGELQELAQANPSLARQSFGPSADVCSAADSAPTGGTQQNDAISKLKSTCSSGQRDALLTNVFIGTAVVGAGLAGFAYYEGFIKHSGDEQAPPSHTASRIQVEPVFSRTAAGLFAQFEF